MLVVLTLNFALIITLLCSYVVINNPVIKHDPTNKTHIEFFFLILMKIFHRNIISSILNLLYPETGFISKILYLLDSMFVMKLQYTIFYSYITYGNIL